MGDEPVPNYLLRQVVDDAVSWFSEADKRERSADERAKRIADAHREGWDKVARAVNDGFRAVADAIRTR